MSAQKSNRRTGRTYRLLLNVLHTTSSGGRMIYVAPTYQALRLTIQMARSMAECVQCAYHTRHKINFIDLDTREVIGSVEFMPANMFDGAVRSGAYRGYKVKPEVVFDLT